MIQLNLGSGAIHTPLIGWTTFDRFAWPVNVCGDLTELPFKSESVQNIHLSHVIEHIPEQLVQPTLDEIRRIIKFDGIFYCSGPDMDRTAAIKSGEWLYWTKEGGSRPGWEHHWHCGVVKLRALLIESGFIPTWCNVIPTGWPPNTHTWPLDLEARFLCRRNDFNWPQSFPSSMHIQI